MMRRRRRVMSRYNTARTRELYEYAKKKSKNPELEPMHDSVYFIKLHQLLADVRADSR